MFLGRLLIPVPVRASVASAAPLIWGPTGDGGPGTWEANDTANWFNGANPVK